MFDCYRELCEKGRKHFAALLFYFLLFSLFFVLRFCLDFNARFFICSFVRSATAEILSVWRDVI